MILDLTNDLILQPEIFCNICEICINKMFESIVKTLSRHATDFCLVYATMRNLAKKERLLECVKSLHKDTLDILQMDVTSRQSILDARDRVVEKRVDILGMLLCQCVPLRL